MKKLLFLTLAVLLLPLAALTAKAELELNLLWTRTPTDAETSCFASGDSVIVITRDSRIYVRNAFTGDSLLYTEINNLWIKNIVMSLDGEYLFVSGRAISVPYNPGETVYKLNFDD